MADGLDQKARCHADETNFKEVNLFDNHGHKDSIVIDSIREDMRELIGFPADTERASDVSRSWL